MIGRRLTVVPFEPAEPKPEPPPIPKPRVRVRGGEPTGHCIYCGAPTYSRVCVAHRGLVS